MTHTTPKRVLAVIRLSHDTEATSSPERQRAGLEEWIRRHGHVPAGWVEDLDISGGMDPFERPGLGPWLGAPDRFDVVAFAELSRAGRDVEHFARLNRWCRERGKRLIICDMEIDLSTTDGETMANVMMAIHQDYRRRIADRMKAAHAKLRADGRYAGGRPPFGYRAVDRAGGGRTLEHDPAYAPVLRRIIRDVTDGVSTYEIARRLNAEGLPTWNDHRAALRVEQALEGGREPKPKDLKRTPTRWSAAAVQQIVANPACAGFRVMKIQDPKTKVWPKLPQIVYEPDGVTPVTATDDPVVSPAEWRAAVTAMKARGQKRERTARSEGMLVGVATCACCGTAVYNQQLKKELKSGTKVYSWYRCQGERRGVECAHPASIVAELAEQQISDELLSVFGATEITREVFDPGEDFSNEIAEVRGRLDDLESDYVDGRYAGTEGRRRYHALHERLTARIDALEALPQRPATTRREPTGETYAQRWERCDRLERRAFLIAEGFKVVIWGKGTQPEIIPDPETGPAVGETDLPPRLWGTAEPRPVDPEDMYDPRPLTEAVARLVCPPTVWHVVKDGVVQPVGTDPLAADFGTDWTELDMVLQVPPNARLGVWLWRYL